MALGPKYDPVYYSAIVASLRRIAAQDGINVEQKTDKWLYEKWFACVNCWDRPTEEFPHEDDVFLAFLRGKFKP